jgi:hypothetical protein
MLNKEEILRKIKRYAEENSGKTPSEKVFYEYADVGIYDLKRCGYAYYGELVSESGLTPNKFDKTKYNNEQLFEMLIGVIREKGKWPTRGELDVKHHADSNFPNSATFYKKLGLVNAMAGNILDYIKNKQGYEDVITICNSVIKKACEPEEINNVKDGEKIGIVYLFKHGKYYKIGKTNDTVRRGTELKIQLPENLDLIHEIKTDDPSGIEAYWHKRFDLKRMNGEWFDLNLSEVKAFKAWKRIV